SGRSHRRALTAGKESIQQGLNSMLLGLGLVIVFMILYYRSSGVVANIALFLNIFLIIGMLAQINAVLTLPGIAGIVLTIGMSVDANVLIFERIKEELAKGRTMRTAVTEGFSRAMSSIIDSNATTFLIGLILFLNGTGAVKGFATTLMIGILCSLFCAIFITRLVIEFILARNGGKGLRFDGLIFRNTFKGLGINFVQLRRPAYILSAIVLSIGIITMIYPGLSLGVDFKGGRSYVIEFNAPVSVKEARQEVIKKLPGSVEVKTFGGNNKLKITTSHLIEDESPEADQKVQELLMAGLKSFENKKPDVVGFSKVGATIADDIAQTAYLAVGLSFLAIFIYIFWRIGEFKLWQYGVGALVALVHDVLILLGLIGIAKLFGIIYEIDQVFIAALLTLVGYSINDTVVVFDRIKENLTTKNKSLQDAMVGEQMNEAINITLSRTIMTSGTTVLVVLMLFLFGGEVLSGFSFSLLVGILVGTYSSIFVASPVFLDVVLWSNKLKAARAKRA
ncbi:MAG: protein translocase subunit SecF, partial [Microscillaceae bacterium]|nr:protein translocase subunit SecF [Microscillaceae bacterium]